MRHTALYSAALGLVLLCTAGSCSKSYDDAPLKGRVETIGKRITSLEARLKTYNDELATLEQLMQGGRYVRELREVKQGTTLVGYEIRMSDGKTFSLSLAKNGKNGKGGIAMSVQQDPSDLEYYWRLNGDWLRDSRGNRIPLYSSGYTTGVAGVTPKLEIRDGAWYVQVAQGEWTRLSYPTQGPQGDAGDPGNAGPAGDPADALAGLIQSITPATGRNAYEMRMVDGTVLYLPGQAQTRIKFPFVPYGSLLYYHFPLEPEAGKSYRVLENGKTYRVPFIIEHPEPDMIVEVKTNRSIKAQVVLTNAQKSEGYVEVTPLMYDLPISPVEERPKIYLMGYFTIYLMRPNRELLYRTFESVRIEKVVEL